MKKRPMKLDNGRVITEYTPETKADEEWLGKQMALGKIGTNDMWREERYEERNKQTAHLAEGANTRSRELARARAQKIRERRERREQR